MPHGTSVSSLDDKSQMALCGGAQACLQVCIKAIVEGAAEARNFLADDCTILKTAFSCDRLLLQPPALGELVNSAGGAKIAW